LSFVKVRTQIASNSSPGGQNNKVATLEKIGKKLATLGGPTCEVMGSWGVQGGHNIIFPRSGARVPKKSFQKTSNYSGRGNPRKSGPDGIESRDTGLSKNVSGNSVGQAVEAWEPFKVEVWQNISSYKCRDFPKKCR